jgi:hypothetical protein
LLLLPRIADQGLELLKAFQNQGLLSCQRWRCIQHATPIQQIHAFIEPGNPAVEVLEFNQLVEEEHKQS